MNKYIREVIIRSNGIIKSIFIKFFHFRNVKVSINSKISPNTEITIDNGGSLEYGKCFILRSGSKIRVRKNGKVKIGSHVGLGNRSFIVCHDEITIGDGSIIGPNVFIYDHDHDYSADNPSKNFITSPVHIGKNVWIGANVVILRGTEIGDNCIIAAGSVLKGKFESNNTIYQKRTTTLIDNNFMRKQHDK